MIEVRLSVVVACGFGFSCDGFAAKQAVMACRKGPGEASRKILVKRAFILTDGFVYITISFNRLRSLQRRVQSQNSPSRTGDGALRSLIGRRSMGIHASRVQ